MIRKCRELFFFPSTQSWRAFNCFLFSVDRFEACKRRKLKVLGNVNYTDPNGGLTCPLDLGLTLNLLNNQFKLLQW